MGNHRKSPLTRPSTPPVVAPVPDCRLGQPCHVNGRGLKTFGKKFRIADVQEMASSSITILGDDASGNPNTPFASGVLIAPEVALCASHSFITQNLSHCKVLMGFECSANTAPPGAAYQYRNATFPSTCTPLATVAQASIVKVLEESNDDEFDYTMLLIKWNSPSPVKLPRVPILPKPAYGFSNEMIMVGHPYDSGKQAPSRPTQAAAFKLLKADGPNPKDPGLGSGIGTGNLNPNTQHAFGYGEFSFTWAFGFSGCGVFNDNGKIVGLLHGAPGDPGTSGYVAGMHRNNFCFLNLGIAEGVTMNDPTRGRLHLWFTTGDPLKKPGDVPATYTPPTFTP